MTRAAGVVARRPTGQTSFRRRIGWIVLVLGVVAAHGCITHEIAIRLDAAAAERAMPPRLAVAYVRTLEIAAPRPVAPGVAPLLKKERPRRAAREAGAASAAAPDSAPARDAGRSDIPSPGAEAEAGTRDAGTGDPTSHATSDATLAGAAAASAAAYPASGDASAVPFEWPVSTRVSYDLVGNYRGPVRGRAQVEWIRVGARYQVHVDLIVGPDIAPLITRRMSSAGTVGDDGLAPDRYDEETHVVLRDPRRHHVRFEPDAVVIANGERRERAAGMQDTASQFIQLTWLFSTRPDRLQTGRTVEVPLALPRGVDRWTYDVLDEETLQTAIGPLRGWHLKPRRGAQKPGDLSAELWFAPGLRYFPVRIRVEQDAQTFIDMTIAKKPELAGG